MNKCLVIFLLLIPSLVFTQYTEDEIDSILYSEIFHLRSEAKYEEIISLCDDIIVSSQDLKYDNGEAWAFVEKANALCSLGEHTKSLEVLSKAKELASSLNDDRLNSYIAIETGRNYGESNISANQAIIAYKDAVKFAQKIKDEYDRETYLLYAYENLYTACWHIGQKEEAISYLWKSLSISESAYSLYGLTYYHINESQNDDSILYYLNRSTAFFKENPEYIFEKGILYNQWGKFYESKGDNKQAVGYFLIAEKLTKESSADVEYLNSLLSLSKNYELIGDTEKAMAYSKKYIQVQDSFNFLYKKNVSQTLDSLVESKDEDLNKQKSSLIVVFIIVLSIILLLFYYLFSRLRKRRREIISKNKELLKEKNKENEILSKQINESYEEVILMAKENHPDFYTRFQEVYPNLNKALLLRNKKLTISELTIAAYIYLGFTTKEIAELTFRSPKTIESTRYNLRKKLSLLPEVNLQKWLIDLKDAAF